MLFIDELFLIYTIVIRNLKQFKYINYFFYLLNICNILFKLIVYKFIYI